jgi:DNA-binding GntR family transcriptional regulator
LSFLKTVNINCDRYTRLHLVFTRDLHRAGQAHHELLEVCRTRDAERASAALWKHITEAGEYLREFIESRRERHSSMVEPAEKNRDRNDARSRGGK